MAYVWCWPISSEICEMFSRSNEAVQGISVRSEGLHGLRALNNVVRFGDFGSAGLLIDHVHQARGVVDARYN